MKTTIIDIDDLFRGFSDFNKSTAKETGVILVDCLNDLKTEKSSKKEISIV